MSMLRFRLGDQVFALGVENVHEVQRMVALHSVPGLPPEVLGVIDVHGQIVPVLDLRQRLGMESKTPTPASPMLIMNSQGHTLAALVDQVEGVVRHEGTLPIGAGWDCVRGVIDLEGQITVVLNADALPTPEIEAMLATPIRSLATRSISNVR